MAEVKLYEKVEPALSAGKYEIDVIKHTLTGNSDIENEATEILGKTPKKIINVFGDQFYIEEKSIAMRYPAKNASGEFSDDLPFISFYEDTLPWIRKGVLSPVWLALIIFRQDSSNDIKVESKQASTFLTTHDARTLITNLKTSDVTNPNDLEVTCNIVTFPMGFLNECLNNDISVFSTRKEALINAQKLCHARLVEMTNSLVTSGHLLGNPIKDGKKRKSVVLANEFPVEEGTYEAHVVSLEGIDLSKIDDDNYDKLTLVSLTNWTFTTAKAAHDSFEKAGNRLFEAANGEYIPPEDLMLRKPLVSNPTNEEKQGKEKKELFGYHSEPKDFWILGPLSPQPIAYNPSIANKGVDEFEIEDIDVKPTESDLKYATAWQLGRLLALSDNTFTSAKRKTKQAFRLSVLRELSIQKSEYSSIKNANNIGVHNNFRINPLEKLLAHRVSEHYVEEVLQKPYKNENTPLQESSKNSIQLTDIIASYQPKTDKRLTNQGEFTVNEKMENFIYNNSESIKGITTLIADVHLLKRIPFSYLVLNESFLPMDSIKFFYVDINWIEALVKGASSLGFCPKQDMGHESALHQSIFRKGGLLAKKDRNTLLKVEQTSNDDSYPEELCGFFIRSSFVKDFPAFQIKATDSQGNEMSPLRIEHFSDIILMCLFDKRPKSITILEPDHGIRYGDKLATVDQSSSINIVKSITKTRQVIKLINKK